ncbi:hypothetical protein [Streptomyces gardneri]|uniref:hypothetical protein n=1 Tax=Streptomyces gardneri TaxID=66892 RepID=UPI0035E28870
MSGTSAQERGELAGDMLLVAARLATIVQGDGGRKEVGAVLHGLSVYEMESLTVVLAGLVDPDRPLGALLGWLDFDEHGRPVTPDTSDPRTLRDLVAEEPEPGTVEIDEVAVAAYAAGRRVSVTPEERILAVGQYTARGMTYEDVDQAHGLRSGCTKDFISARRTAYRRHGWQFPNIQSPGGGRRFTEEQVVDIRIRTANGTTADVLALEYDTEPNVIGDIARGRRHPKFGGPIRQPKRGPSRNTRKYWVGDGESAKYAAAS